jgi:hypothetical protein
MNQRGGLRPAVIGRLPKIKSRRVSHTRASAEAKLAKIGDEKNVFPQRSLPIQFSRRFQRCRLNSKMNWT